MCNWHCGLEWKADTREDGYRGAGIYNLENAWRLDALFDAAAREGIAIQLCLGTYGEFTTGGFFNEGQWKDNPYNAVNGGPCAKPEEFWSNAAARTLYQRRLRYLAARYGCRTNLFGWEFWNEAHAPASWVSEMAQYMKGTGAYHDVPADPYRHLLTTSYGDDAVWQLPEIDYTQTHHYGMGDLMDHAPIAQADAVSHLRYDKPHLLAEFGIDWRKSDAEYDKDGVGVNLHNGLWASLLAGDAGTGMIWWWDNYVHPKKLYPQFAAIRRFSDSIPWQDGPWRTLQAEPATAGGAESWSDCTLSATGGWEKTTGEVTVTPAGPTKAVMLPHFLFSPGKPELRAPFTFTSITASPGVSTCWSIPCPHVARCASPWTAPRRARCCSTPTRPPLPA